MKNILNLIFGIQSGHFYRCPNVKGLGSVDEDPECHCQDKCYDLIIYIGLAMFALELAGGIFTNSLSLVGDSLHLLADSFAAVVGRVVNRAIKKTPNKKDQYRKLGVIINGLLLLLFSASLFSESFFKFLHPASTFGGTMTIIAVVGLVGNFFQYFLLISIRVNSEKDLVRTSIILHFFTDILQSIAVVIGGICLIFITDFSKGCLVDPMLSTGIAFLMGFAAIKLLLQVFVPDDEHNHGHHHH